MKKIIVFFLSLFFLVGCSGGTNTPNYEKDGYSVKVTYHLGEGTWNDSHDLEFQYKPNSKVGQIGIDFAKGETPSLANHTLEGWYVDSEFTQPFDFNNTLTVEGEELHLYAKWIANISYYFQVVCFDENNQEIEVQRVSTVPGNTFEKKIVRRRGYIILGYFQDAKCSIPWDDSIVMREANEGEKEVVHKVYSTWLTDDFAIVTNAKEFNAALNRGKNIYLTDNIDFSQTEYSYSSIYSGTIEGNGHIISNITINSLDSVGSDKKPSFGMFGSLSGATIKDLNIENLNLIVETRVQVEIYVGTLAGTIENSTISNVSITGKLTIAKEQSKLNKLDYNITEVGQNIDQNSVIENQTVNFTVEDLRV